MVIRVDERPLDVAAVRRAFLTAPGFERVRENTPVGESVEADYRDGEWCYTISLNESHDALAVRGTSDAALRALWIIKEQLGVPLRIFDTAYSFDLRMSDFSTLAELETAIHAAWSQDSGG